MVTTFDVEVSRLEIPHELGEHTHLKVPPLHPIWALYPTTCPADQLPPDVGNPAEIKQFDALFFRRVLIFNGGCDEPFAAAGLVKLQKMQRGFHRGILRRGSEGDDGKQTKEHGMVALVGGPQKLLVGVAGKIGRASCRERVESGEGTVA